MTSDEQSAEPAVAAVVAVAALGAVGEHARLKAKPKPKTMLCVCLNVRRLSGLNGLLCLHGWFSQARD